MSSNDGRSGDMKLTGFDDLESKLVALEKKVAKGIVRKAVRGAQKMLLRQVKLNAVNMVGGELGRHLAKGFVTKAIYKQRKGSYQLQVAIHPDKADDYRGDGTTNAYLPYAIEYGHIARGGGAVAAVPFVRAASDKTNEARIKFLQKAIKDGVNNA